MKTYRFIILGGGAWGLTLAKLLSENSHTVHLWEYNPQYVQILREKRSNPWLLPDVILPQGITFTANLQELCAYPADFLITAVPSQFLRRIIRQAAPFFAGIHNLQAIINVAKGIEEKTGSRMSEVLKEELPARYNSKIVCLSGPSHAEEVARQIPTAVVIAGGNTTLLKKLQQIFSNVYFRVYRCDDLTGVEIGGAVKNIIAIAAGIIDSLGYGDNTKGALITRGVVEIQRLGIVLGALPETFLGLSGMGDLITTATSTHSRNRFVGYYLGKGKSLAAILQNMNSVAEGVTTTRSVRTLAQQLKVEMPITEKVYQILFKGVSPQTAIIELMTRSLKSE